MFKQAIFAIFSMLLLLYSCDVTNDSSSDSTTGTFRVFLTDAPANFEAVWIDIQEVKVHLNDDEEIESNDNGWITVSEEPMRVNLLDLTNGELAVLGEADLEAGTYSQIRLVMGEDNEIVKNGVTHSLDTPSAQESGLKLNINAEIEGGEIYTLLLDFDASRSIVEAGKSGKFLLKPVIRTVEFAQTGAVEGTVEPAESLPWVYAISNSDTLGGTKANTDGEFRIVGLLSGTYQIAVNPSEGDYSELIIENVDIASPDTTRLGVITLTE